VFFSAVSEFLGTNDVVLLYVLKCILRFACTNQKYNALQIGFCRISLKSNSQVASVLSYLPSQFVHILSNITANSHARASVKSSRYSVPRTRFSVLYTTAAYTHISSREDAVLVASLHTVSRSHSLYLTQNLVLISARTSRVHALYFIRRRCAPKL